MKTKEEIKKIESVVLYILKNFKEGVDYIKLFKIMYFAQKEYLLSYGKVLCPDTFKARKYGPVPVVSDKVLKRIEAHESFSDLGNLKSFSKSIRVDENQRVFSLQEPDTDYLSRKECECLDRWIDYCRDKDSIKVLSPESHDAAYEAAWKAYQDDPQMGKMTLIEIARAGGASEKLIAYIREKELMKEQLS